MGRLKDYSVTLYFYNPNIDTLDEYRLRAGELEKLKEAFTIENIVVADYDNKEFYKAAEGLEDCPEGGERCNRCIELRLNDTADFAVNNGFDIFTTTLSVSPHKNSKVINALGEKAAADGGVKFLEADFKKEGGFNTANLVAKELDIYRQRYCGCKFQKR